MSCNGNHVFEALGERRHIDSWTDGIHEFDMDCLLCGETVRHKFLNFLYIPDEIIEAYHEEFRKRMNDKYPPPFVAELLNPPEGDE